MANQLQYGAICKGYVVLVSHQDPQLRENAERYLTDFLRTFSAKPGMKTSFKALGLKFHIEVQSGMVFCCGATLHTGAQLPYSFLAELSKKFAMTTLPPRAYNAGEHEFDREFQAVLRETLDSFNGKSSPDQLQQLQGQVNDVRVTVEGVIDKTIDRGASLEDLEKRTSDLEDKGRKFEKETRKLRDKIRNIKMLIIIGGVVFVVVLLIVLGVAGVL